MSPSQSKFRTRCTAPNGVLGPISYLTAGQQWGSWMDRKQMRLVCSGLDNFPVSWRTFKVERSWNGSKIFPSATGMKRPWFWCTYGSWSGILLGPVIIQNIHGHFGLSRFVREVYWYLRIEARMLQASHNAQVNLPRQRRIWLQVPAASRFSAGFVKGLCIHLSNLQLLKCTFDGYKGSSLKKCM